MNKAKRTPQSAPYELNGQKIACIEEALRAAMPVIQRAPGVPEQQRANAEFLTRRALFILSHL